MRTTKRAPILAVLLTALSELAFIATPVLAQSGSRRVPNTYEDFPYNQGSLFYAPRGSNASSRRTRQAPRRFTAPPQPATVAPYYAAPQPRPTYYTVPQPRPTYYTVPQPRPTYYAAPQPWPTYYYYVQPGGYPTR